MIVAWTLAQVKEPSVIAVSSEANFEMSFDVSSGQCGEAIVAFAVCPLRKRRFS